MQTACVLILFPLIIGSLVFRKVLLVGRRIGKNPITSFREGALGEKLRVLGVFSWSFVQIVFGFFLFLGWQPRLIFESNSVTFLTGAFLLALGCFVYQIAASTMGSAYRIGVDRQQQTSLISNGIYRYVRHPIYSAVFAFLLGVFLIFPHAFFLLSLICGSFGIYRQVASEEKFLEETFGEKFLDYKKQTGRFLPKFFCCQLAFRKGKKRWPC